MNQQRLQDNLPVFDRKVDHSGQKHQDGYLVDGMHGLQVEIALPVRVFLAKEIGSNFCEIE
jgi:hypothetical protein